jgi:hypothetical protein
MSGTREWAVVRLAAADGRTYHLPTIFGEMQKGIAATTTMETRGIIPTAEAIKREFAAMKTVVVEVKTFRTEVWWAGENRPNVYFVDLPLIQISNRHKFDRCNIVNRITVRNEVTMLDVEGRLLQRLIDFILVVRLLRAMVSSPLPGAPPNAKDIKSNISKIGRPILG